MMANQYTITTDNSAHAIGIIRLLEGIDNDLVTDDVVVALWFWIGKLIPMLYANRSVEALVERYDVCNWDEMARFVSVLRGHADSIEAVVKYHQYREE